MRLKKIDKILLILLAVILAVFAKTVYANLTGTEGLAIDLSSAGAGQDFTIAFDPTELLGNRTWGDGSTDTIVWTWNRSTGADPTITFNSGSIALPALTLTTDLAVAEGGTGQSNLTDLITLTTHTVGNYSNGNAEGGDALVTIAVEITDNESTAENNPLVFVAGGDDDGGDLGLETDGDAHYNPSTGTITATEFVGGGAGLTALAGTNITANTIDEPALETTNAAGSGTDNYLLSYNHAATNFTWVASIGGGSMNSFIAEDGDGTEVEIDDSDEWKFVEGAGIDIDWTDVSDGTDGDPFDLTFTVALGTSIAAAEMANEDHGDVQWNGGDADVESMDLGDATTGTYYLGLFADDTGTSRPIYADAPLSYAQASGTLTATEFVGGGSGLTLASTDLSDTADLLYEAELDDLSELTTQIADVATFITDDIMPDAGTDPDVDAAGELSIDTDGANEPNDVTLRTSSVSGNQQYALANVLKSIQGTVITPNNLSDATRDACPIWENNTGMIFTVTMIRMWSDTTATTVNVETVDSDWDNNATVNAMEIDTAEVANFSTEDSTITAGTIAVGSLIVLDFDDTDEPGWVKFNIMGWFNANVD